jgi:NAD(P)-dependent dehydrogenase (short-subunit alcohol dehydrogenase family)
MMSMLLSGKTIVVTGAASGIGAQTVRELQQAGAVVIGVDRNPVPKADRYVAADLSQPTSISKALHEIGSGIDGLCNIAGLPPTRGAEPVLRVNFLGLRELTEGLIGQLRDGAAIVNLASLAGLGWAQAAPAIKALLALRDFEALDAYCREHAVDDGRSYFLSKEALIVWTMLNRWTWRERGIRMNCVSPGPVDTPILGDFLATLGARAEEDMKVMDRAGTPADIAPLVAFLCSPQSAWIRGTNIACDGGMYAHVLTHMHDYE